MAAKKNSITHENVNRLFEERGLVNKKPRLTGRYRTTPEDFGWLKASKASEWYVKNGYSLNVDLNSVHFKYDEDSPFIRIYLYRPVTVDDLKMFDYIISKLNPSKIKPRKEK